MIVSISVPSGQPEKEKNWFWVLNKYRYPHQYLRAVGCRPNAWRGLAPLDPVLALAEGVQEAAPALVTTVQLRDWDDGGGVVAEVVGGDGHHSSVHPTGSFSKVVLSQGAVN